jgi:hypothetical protein
MRPLRVALVGQAEEVIGRTGRGFRDVFDALAPTFCNDSQYFR